MREERNSASRWKTVAFYRHHASANAKASGLRRSKRMSTLIAKHNNCDPRDVECRFPAESREIFRFAGQSICQVVRTRYRSDAVMTSGTAHESEITNALHKAVQT
jgi:hypothetical protein